MSDLITLPYTLSDGTEGFCQADASIPPEQREAFLAHVVKNLEENLRLRGETSG